MIEMEEENKKIETKYRWESIDVIPLFPLVEVNNLSTYNTNFQQNGISLYNIWKINPFSIGYMINP